MGGTGTQGRGCNHNMILIELKEINSLKPVGSVTIEGGEVAASEEGDDDPVDALQLVKVSVLRKLSLKYRMLANWSNAPCGQAKG